MHIDYREYNIVIIQYIIVRKMIVFLILLLLYIGMIYLL